MGLLKPSESLRQEVPITSDVMANRSKTQALFIDQSPWLKNYLVITSSQVILVDLQVITGRIARQ